jgi:hypothetical protein
VIGIIAEDEIGKNDKVFFLTQIKILNAMPIKRAFAARDLLGHTGIIAFKSPPNHFLKPQLIKSPYQIDVFYGFGTDANPERFPELYKILCFVKSSHLKADRQGYFPLITNEYLKSYELYVRKATDEEVRFMEYCRSKAKGIFELEGFWGPEIQKHLPPERKVSKETIKSRFNLFLNFFSGKKKS